MSEKAVRTTYWVSTALIAFAMLGAGIQDSRHAPELLEGARRLGYPDYLLSIIGAAKLAGVPVLLIQKFPHLKEWAYAGFCVDLGGAIASHVIVGDTVEQTAPALVCITLLAISYVSYRRLGGVGPVGAVSAA
jgi:hypothetical protein